MFPYEVSRIKHSNKNFYKNEVQNGYTAYGINESFCLQE